MAWDLGLAVSFKSTGTGFGWWIAWGDTLGQHLIYFGDDVGRPAITHHFQCGGGRSGGTPDLIGGRRRGRLGRVGKGGAATRRIFLQI